MYIYIYIILVTLSRYGCPNGMYKIHVVQFLALSLPFSPRRRTKAEERISPF